MTTLTSTDTRRAGLYLRISQDKTGLEAGVTRQERDCRELCERLGWVPVDIYRDNDVSAFSGKRRPEYERLKEDLVAGRIDAVVTWHPDRLYRRVADLLQLLELVTKAGVRMATVQAGDVDLATPTGQAMAQMAAVFAQLESAHKAERVKRWHIDRAEAGLPGGGKRPYGFQADRIGHDPTEAAMIREAAGRVLAGELRYSIVTDWNTRGIPTVTGAAWSTMLLGQILRSPRIAGFRQHRGKLHPAAWQPILEPDVWGTVQIALKTTRTPPGRPVEHLLSGIAVCGLCRTGMTGNRTAAGVPGYRCPPIQSHGHGCGKVARNGPALDSFIAEAIFEALAGPGLHEALAARQAGDDTATEAMGVLTDLENRLKRLKAEYATEGIWSKSDFLEQKAELESRIRKVSDDLGNRTPRRGLEDLPTGVEGLRAWWAAAPVVRRRQLVELVLDKIIVHPTGRRGRTFDPTAIEVHWRA